MLHKNKSGINAKAIILTTKFKNEVLAVQRRRLSVRFAWVPCHSGIKEKDQTDRLSQKGRKVLIPTPRQNQAIKITFSFKGKNSPYMQDLVDRSSLRLLRRVLRIYPEKSYGLFTKCSKYITTVYGLKSAHCFTFEICTETKFIKNQKLTTDYI